MCVFNQVESSSGGGWRTQVFVPLAILALSVGVLGCDCEKSREKGLLMLDQVHDASLACCRKLEAPELVMECMQRRESQRACVAKIIDDAYTRCLERRGEHLDLILDDVDRVFKRALKIAAECHLLLVRGPTGEVLNPIPVLPIDTVAVQLFGAQRAVDCQATGDATIGYRVTGAIAFDGSGDRLPMTMEFAVHPVTPGIDEGVPQSVACCAVTVQLDGARVNLWLDASEPSVVFQRGEQEYLGLALNGVIVREPSSVPPSDVTPSDEGGEKKEDPCDKFPIVQDGELLLDRPIWLELPIDRSGPRVSVGSRNTLAAKDVFPQVPNPTADWNGDLVVDGLDVNAFYADPVELRDLTGDGSYDAHDEARFLERWNAAQI